MSNPWPTNPKAIRATKGENLPFGIQPGEGFTPERTYDLVDLLLFALGAIVIAFFFMGAN